MAGESTEGLAIMATAERMWETLRDLYDTYLAEDQLPAGVILPPFGALSAGSQALVVEATGEALVQLVAAACLIDEVELVD